MLRMDADRRKLIKDAMQPYEHIETKQCPVCAEAIPAAAVICPRCRQWLSFRSFRHPLLRAVFGGLFAIAFLILLFRAADRFETFFNPPPYYGDFKDSIRILQSNMNWVDTSDGARLFLTGILTNESSVAWKSPEFECRFFDVKGQMVDAANGYAYLTVLPGADSAFRVSVKPGLSSNDYSSFTIRVNDARNVKRPF